MSTTFSISRLLVRPLQGVLKEGRKFCATHFATKEFEEVKIKVPWGHLSGKWYGPKDKRPIVGLHGWQDNAGTFDTIAPLLPSNIGFFSIDLPGHGLSSWLPDGLTYHSIDYVTLLLTIMREYNWDKISMICHSMSSINGFIFCSLFPEKCDMFVGLDVLKPLIRPNTKIITHITERINRFHKFDDRNRSKSEPTCYEYEEMIEKLHDGTGKSVSKECCQFLLKRNMKASIHQPHKFYFSRDNRLKGSLFYAFNPETIIEMAQRITCPHLFIKALQAPYYEDKKYYDEVIGLLKKKSNFEYYEVDGTHHVHLNEPRKIADIINPFINLYRPE